MEWNKKHEMNDAGSLKTRNPQGGTELFYAFVKENIKQFDMQDWSIFIEYVEISEDELIAHKEFWQHIQKPLGKALDSKEFFIHTSLRIALIQTLLVECKIYHE